MAKEKAEKASKKKVKAGKNNCQHAKKTLTYPEEVELSSFSSQPNDGDDCDTQNDMFLE